MQNLKYPWQIFIYCPIISWTVSSLRVVIIRYLWPCTSQPPVQTWATYKAFTTPSSLSSWFWEYFKSHRRISRTPLLHTSQPVSRRGTVRWETEEDGCSTPGRLCNVEKKIPQWQIKAQLLNSSSPHCPVWPWKNFISALKKKELWASCFFIAEVASSLVSKLSL